MHRFDVKFGDVLCTNLITVEATEYRAKSNPVCPPALFKFTKSWGDLCASYKSGEEFDILQTIRPNPGLCDWFVIKYDETKTGIVPSTFGTFRGRTKIEN